MSIKITVGLPTRVNKFLKLYTSAFFFKYFSNFEWFELTTHAFYSVWFIRVVHDMQKFSSIMFHDKMNILNKYY